MEQPTTVKLCECGCGKPAPIATRTSGQRGIIKGQPQRFVSGHSTGYPKPVISVEVGQRIGHGVVLDANVRVTFPSSKNGLGKRAARLLCDCGEEYVRTLEVLVGPLAGEPRSQSCGCLGHGRFTDRTGWRSGNLVVIGFAGMKVKPNGNAESRWLCRCDCGNETFATTGNWSRRTSCGCARRKPRQGRAIGEAAKDRVLREYRNGARDRGLAWELATEDFYRLVKLDCFYCGYPPIKVRRNGTYNGEFTYNGLDRIDSRLGYTLENVVTCCEVCNRAKRDMPYGDFMAWIARLTEYHWFHPELTPSHLLKR